MDWVRRLWFALALVGVLGAVGVFLGAVYGSAGLAVASVSVSGQTPTNATANCDGVVVRNVDVTVVVERAGLRPGNPQWWQVGVSVRATAFDAVKTRQRTLAPGGRVTVTVPFTSVRDEQWAPRRRVTVVVQVLSGNTEVAQRTATATLVPVTAGRNC